MLTVAIYIKDVDTNEYNRIDLFDDEKISVTSSIQNINDISKTFTDFSQTFTVPASVQNNKIFRHWYDNSNDAPFSTLVKSDAYIEIDTITFRKGKIQLESANLVDGQAQNYSITFIGILGNLKDTFDGLYLKDLNTSYYDIDYTSNNVYSRVVDNVASRDVMFPLISSSRLWSYDDSNGVTNNIGASATYGIRHNELFPAIRISALFNMIETKFLINFDGAFLTDTRFRDAYLWLKNAETFSYYSVPQKITFNQVITYPPSSTVFFSSSIETYSFRFLIGSATHYYSAKCNVLVTSGYGFPYKVSLYKNGREINSRNATAGGTTVIFDLLISINNVNPNDVYNFYISSEQPITFEANNQLQVTYSGNNNYMEMSKSPQAQTTIVPKLPLNSYMPEIKIEDFFSGILKMFNLTCFSEDGINYTIEQLQSYYDAGNNVEITKYVLQDKKDLNRVKTYKRINFQYEKSQSFINVAFNSQNGIEYGSLLYNTGNDGEEYSIKLPFENLNFNNLIEKLQVGYSLKTDFKSYIPKPTILFDYQYSGTQTVPQFYIGGINFTYKAFGQEVLFDNGTIYGLNFPTQVSTLNNETVVNGLYKQYYENYLSNIFNYKSRLIKLSAILPTSILTSLKLNDSIIIRDAKYKINTFTTDLTTGLVQFELLTDIGLLEQINVITEILIGEQIWTTQNLSVTTYADGVTIPYVSDPEEWRLLETGAWCYVNNDPATEPIYGRLYNWYAVNDSRGLAPVGYHIPTRTEWETLRTTLGGSSLSGGKLKSTGTLEGNDGYWFAPNNANNSSLFSANPSGLRYGLPNSLNNDFNRVGYDAYFWTSTQKDSENAYDNVMFNSTLTCVETWKELYFGLAVRLIKD
jgi:uncharacterized protein (TIGR02145 family)